jgi:hypothetical protein
MTSTSSITPGRLGRRREADHANDAGAPPTGSRQVDRVASPPASRLTLPSAQELPIRVRLRDGRLFAGSLPVERHRRIQLGMLHADSRGFIEISPGTRPPAGKLRVDRRRWRQHYLASDGDPRAWLGRALKHVEEIVGGRWQHPAAEQYDPPREEVFVGVTPRTRRQSNKEFVAESRFLWVDVDDPEELPLLWSFLRERPAHLVVMSGGSGGAHAYWRLAEPLPGHSLDPATGELTEPIERFNQRIIHHLGRFTDDGARHGGRRVFVGADRACADRSRVMRLAGTVNHKTGQHAQIAWADFALAGYDIEALVGDLSDMPHSKATGRGAARRRDRWGTASANDPFRAIPPSDYFWRIAQIEVPQYGNVRCPHRDHSDLHPSCSVGLELWKCHGSTCDAAGGIYDLASAVLGGPTGRALRGSAFIRAKDLVRRTYPDLRDTERTS